MDFGILGPVRAWVGGADVALGGAKQRTVLAALLLAGGRVLSNTRLSTLLWDCDPPATASAQIHTYVSRLRNRFGPGVQVVRQRPGYLIRLDGAWLDLEAFEALVRTGHGEMSAGRYENAAERFRSALALWRGPALSNVTQFLADAAAPELDEARMAALESRIEAELCLGRHTHLVSELTGLVAEFPFRERLRVQLMTALYRCDRQADALAAYDEGRHILVDELGVDPGAALAMAHRAVLTGELALERHTVPGIEHAADVWTSVRPSLLPPDVVDFTGREAQLGGLYRWLRARPTVAMHRTVSLLTGMAGVGKTALAVRAAHASADEFPNGQLYADLGGVAPHARRPFDVLGLFLRALGVDEQAIPGSLDERVHLYRSLLADQRLLILLDDAVEDGQVHHLLPGGSQCRVVVSSRRHLATLDGVDVVNLEVLDGTEALRLISTIIGPQRVNAERAAAAEIVRLCGRLPLALRVAAGRLAARPQWPLARLAHRLRHERCRLDELQLDGLSVRTALQRSYRTLDDDARAAFHRLSRLDRPWFTVQAATRVLDVPESLAEARLEVLADFRLLEVAGVDHDGLLRYRFHDLVRCLARESAVPEYPAALAGCDLGGAADRLAAGTS